MWRKLEVSMARRCHYIHWYRHRNSKNPSKQHGATNLDEIYRSRDSRERLHHKRSQQVVRSWDILALLFCMPWVLRSHTKGTTQWERYQQDFLGAWDECQKTPRINWIKCQSSVHIWLLQGTILASEGEDHWSTEKNGAETGLTLSPRIATKQNRGKYICRRITFLSRFI